MGLLKGLIIGAGMTAATNAVSNQKSKIFNAQNPKAKKVILEKWAKGYNIFSEHIGKPLYVFEKINDTTYDVFDDDVEKVGKIVLENKEVLPTYNLEIIKGNKTLGILKSRAMDNNHLTYNSFEVSVNPMDKTVGVKNGEKVLAVTKQIDDNAYYLSIEDNSDQLEMSMVVTAALIGLDKIHQDSKKYHSTPRFLRGFLD